MADFQAALPKTLAHEGVTFDSTGNPVPGKTGWVNHVDDSGGETNYGITKATALAAGYIGDMKDIPFDTVKRIYKTGYWDKVWGDNIPDQRIAEKLFDIAVNMGVGVAAWFLQRVLNVHNKKGTLYPDVVVDKVIGSGTVAVLRTALAVAPYFPENIWKGLNGLQTERYIQIAETNQKLESFVPGWIRTRIGV